MSAREYIGLDVGGTKAAVATYRAGVLSESYTEPTELSSAQALIEQFVRLVARTRSAETAAIGVGVPSVVEFATGRVRSSVNIPLADVPLRSVLSERVGIPVFVENDANCAALAEAYDGERMVSTQLVMLTVGTGVGGGIVLNGRVFRGATGAAPELGHTMIALDLQAAGELADSDWPRPGTLEALASGSALDALADAAARQQPESALGRTLADTGEVTGRDAVHAAAEGDDVAVGVLTTLGRRLGIGIANVINTFDPLEVVIGGGVSNAGELLLGPARDTAARYTLPGVGTLTKIRVARHGVQSGVLGAALIAVHEEDPT